jgi:F-type H+-transporting ATPase subunit delta
MAENVTIARPYARAAFDYARTHGTLPAWSRALAAAQATIATPEVARLLTDPRVMPSDLVDLLAGACGDSLDEHGRNFLAVLAENRRLGLLPEIATMFDAMRADVENVADVRVVSAVELSADQRERLAKALRKRLARDVRMSCEVDPALLGGAVIMSGDLVIDGSLRSRLARLAAQMAN